MEKRIKGGVKNNFIKTFSKYSLQKLTSNNYFYCSAERFYAEERPLLLLSDTNLKSDLKSTAKDFSYDSPKTSAMIAVQQIVTGRFRYQATGTYRD